MKLYKKIVSLILVSLFLLNFCNVSVFAYTRLISDLEELKELQINYPTNQRWILLADDKWYDEMEPIRQNIRQKAAIVREHIESSVEYQENWYGFQDEYIRYNRSHDLGATEYLIKLVQAGEKNYNVQHWGTEAAFFIASAAIVYCGGSVIYNAGAVLSDSATTMYINISAATAARIAGLGSTGRTIPLNLTEKLAMEEVISNPNGIKIPIQMTDVRWLASEGWNKFSQTVNGVEIHYLYNHITGLFDDFKFK